MNEEMKMPIHIVDLYPDKAQYRNGDKVGLVAELYNGSDAAVKAKFVCHFTWLGSEVGRLEGSVFLPPRSLETLRMDWSSPKSGWSGYGADMELYADEAVISRQSTAFDVVPSWNTAIRYGFLSDFYKEDEEDLNDIKQMCKYHLNAIQFYDWMYKHDDLIPRENHFIDPLGRELSLLAIRNKIHACHQAGMKAFAYGAIYAADKDFFDRHTDWALYNSAGYPENLNQWLYIMNTAPECPWVGHIIGEYEKCIRELDFDGIHMDTYGFPKRALSIQGKSKKVEHPDRQFPLLIEATRSRLQKAKGDVGLIFNAVNNWPVDTVAAASQDAVYVEVWDPNERYIHLYDIIKHARLLGNKPVILAAYLKVFSKKAELPPEEMENSFLLTSAVIFASGGYHLLLGEKNGVLTEGYYVRYGELRECFERTARNYYDFIVRYANLLYDSRLEEISMTYADGINGEIRFEGGSFSSYGEPDKVWTIIKQMPGYRTIGLVNLTGVESDIWNEGKKQGPTPLTDIKVRAAVYEEVKAVWVASPDLEDGRPEKLEHWIETCEYGRFVHFTVPHLKVWDLVFMELEE